jgi:peptidylprolyl isomerase domain and WD repeat-containing protein 1
MSAAAPPAGTSSNGSNLGKRPRDEAAAATAGGQEDAETSEDDDDDLGPMPMPATATAATVEDAPAKAAKKRKILKHEKVFLDNVPSADRYYSGSGQLLNTQS